MSERIQNSLTDGVPVEMEIKLYESFLRDTRDLTDADRQLFEKFLAAARAELKKQTEQS